MNNPDPITFVLTSLIMLTVFVFLFAITDRVLNHFSKEKHPFDLKFAIINGLIVLIMYYLASRFL
ncbi:hypothetical protein [Macrococcus carouselicus]|uniref:Uncharacterized protein n=1 Tax=Macrococcus carouselicus TaxID=69969 RepID=A0A9Q8FQ39_9STAP|nr:hypothetical protein [Macrococcus carouselicus]TDM02147.1 hypothetical protein ERX40_06200 [Macrococcus carouselicus]